LFNDGVNVVILSLLQVVKRPISQLQLVFSGFSTMTKEAKKTINMKVKLDSNKIKKFDNLVKALKAKSSEVEVKTLFSGLTKDDLLEVLKKQTKYYAAAGNNGSESMTGNEDSQVRGIENETEFTHASHVLSTDEAVQMTLNCYQLLNSIPSSPEAGLICVVDNTANIKLVREGKKQNWKAEGMEYGPQRKYTYLLRDGVFHSQGDTKRAKNGDYTLKKVKQPEQLDDNYTLILKRVWHTSHSMPRFKRRITSFIHAPKEQKVLEKRALVEFVYVNLGEGNTPRPENLKTSVAKKTQDSDKNEESKSKTSHSNDMKQNELDFELDLSDDDDQDSDWNELYLSDDDDQDSDKNEHSKSETSNSYDMKQNSASSKVISL
jgi:ribosomal protein L12E/L44/L45/RPP1/RPP2